MSSAKISLIVPKFAKTTIDTIARRFQVEKSLSTTIQDPITIQDLPDEIFDIIFKFVFTLHKNPFILLRVSTRWRRLVMANPHLWTCIRIDQARLSGSRYAQSPDFGRMYTTGFREPGVDQALYGRYHICGDDKQLIDSLRRARSLPIEVFYQSEQGPSTHNPCLEMILRGPTSYRIEVFSLLDGDWRIQFLREQPNQMSFPILRQLTLTAERTDWPLLFLRNIDRGSPMLMHLQLRTKLDDSIINLGIWSKLDMLEIQPLLMPSNILHEVLKRCTKLIEFRSSVNHWPDSSDPPDFQILGNVLEVRLGCPPWGLYTLNLQNLQTLHYRNVHPLVEYTFPDKFLFPQLTTLKLETKHPFNYIKLWEMPWLLDLSISYQSRESCRHSLIHTSFSTVTKFHMETAEYNPSLSLVFQLVPNVRHLSFAQHHQVGYIFKMSHLVDQTVRLCKAGVCLELQTLTLGDFENLIWPPTPKMVKSILKARRKKSMSMIDFYVWNMIRTGNVKLYRYPLYLS